MIDISERNVDLECPQCGAIHTVKLSDIAAETTLNCTCGTNIKLVDKDGSMAHGIQEVNSGFRRLEETIRKINQR